MGKTNNTKHNEHLKNTEPKIANLENINQKLEFKNQKKEIKESRSQETNETFKSLNQQTSNNEIKTIETAEKNEIKKSAEEIEKLKEENLQLKDQFLRLKADFENYKKRILRERQEQELRIKAETIAPFINILDDLERARNSAENTEVRSEKSEVRSKKSENKIPADKSLKENNLNTSQNTKNNEITNSILQGIDLIIKNMQSILSARGVEKIKTVGELFNPNLHEILLVEEKEGFAEGIILEELTAGYKIKNVVIRTAKVKVAKAIDHKPQNLEIEN